MAPGGVAWDPRARLPEGRPSTSGMSRSSLTRDEEPASRAQPWKMGWCHWHVPFGPPSRAIRQYAVLDPSYNIV